MKSVLSPVELRIGVFVQSWIPWTGTQIIAQYRFAAGPISKATLYGTLRRMSTAGLLKIKPGRKDRRESFYCGTTKLLRWVEHSQRVYGELSRFGQQAFGKHGK